MVRYGFVIDHNRCIGCHACTVACKEEHGVPVGVFRTWVKYIEKGEFPATSRHFGVMRCNHCDDAPCIEICPTKALHYRDNRIVDFDNSRCIGCKSCMQACPYDALYIDPNTNTAAKCNFCAHRIELNLEPSCVVVCPTRAIIAGDLDDPQSNVSTIIATQKVAARKPHKGTQPKLFYVGIEGDFLQPEMMIPQESHLFAEHNPAANLGGLRDGGMRAVPGSARVVYDVAHPQPWGSASSLYLWTKSIAAGVLILPALLAQIFGYAGGALFTVACPIAALLFTALTTILLVAHLERPDRFYYMLIKPNPRSWLVWGAWILIAYSASAAAWLAFGFLTGEVPRSIVVLCMITATASAAYSAFLFAQAKGRDLWQSPLFFWILLLQTVVAGSAVLILIVAGHGVWSGVRAGGQEVTHALDAMLVAGVLLNLLMALAQVSLPPYTAEARQAIAAMTRGKLGSVFWYGVVLAGSVVPVLLMGFLLETGANSGAVAIGASILALVGLFCFDEVWIKAGQAPPLS